MTSHEMAPAELREQRILWYNHLAEATPPAAAAAAFFLKYSARAASSLREKANLVSERGKEVQKICAGPHFLAFSMAEAQSEPPALQ